MSVQVITTEDLERFRIQLLEDLKLMISPAKENSQFLRSRDVKKILNISTGTLQNMRVNGSLHPVRVGGILFYNREEIVNLLHKSK